MVRINKKIKFLYFDFKLKGKRGRGENELSMPVNVIVDDCTERVYVLDPGNSRIKCLTLDGKFIGHLGKNTEINIQFFTLNSEKRFIG